MKTNTPTVIDQRIYLVRGHKVMFDVDLALLYGVSTKALNQAVKRNLGRFPEDFMFRLNTDEAAAMRSQSVTASKRNIGRPPYAFTEHGALMLASVLNSPVARTRIWHGSSRNSKESTTAGSRSYSRLSENS